MAGVKEPDGARVVLEDVSASAGNSLDVDDAGRVCVNSVAKAFQNLVGRLNASGIERLANDTKAAKH